MPEVDDGVFTLRSFVESVGVGRVLCMVVVAAISLFAAVRGLARRRDRVRMCRLTSSVSNVGLLWALCSFIAGVAELSAAVMRAPSEANVSATVLLAVTHEFGLSLFPVAACVAARIGHLMLVLASHRGTRTDATAVSDS